MEQSTVHRQETQLSLFLIAVLVVIGGILTYFYFTTPATDSATNTQQFEEESIVLDQELIGDAHMDKINISKKGQPNETTEENMTNNSEFTDTGSTLGTAVIRENGQNKTIYVVKETDCCLWTISEKIYGDPQKWTDLAKVNNLPQNSQGRPIIKTGDTLTLPDNIERIDTVPTKHTVAQGDTLWDLAVRYYGDGFSYHKIMEANHIERSSTTGNPLIDPGMVLIIPA